MSSFPRFASSGQRLDARLALPYDVQSYCNDVFGNRIPATFPARRSAMKSLRLLNCVSGIALFALAAAPAQEKQAVGKGIDAATVAAYEKLGATYGGWEKHKFGFVVFKPGQVATVEGLPGFRFTSRPKAKLPAISVPFGLAFRSITDAGLKELASLKNLA